MSNTLQEARGKSRTVSLKDAKEEKRIAHAAIRSKLQDRYVKSTKAARERAEVSIPFHQEMMGIFHAEGDKSRVVTHRKAEIRAEVTIRQSDLRLAVYRGKRSSKLAARLSQIYQTLNGLNPTIPADAAFEAVSQAFDSEPNGSNQDLANKANLIYLGE